jgi:NADH:ubiquinone reductase (H+-translocating)
VEIHTNATLEHVDAGGVVVKGKRIAGRAVFWTAGVTPSPAGPWLQADTDRAGRVHVRPDLTVPGRPRVCVIGDTASLEQYGKPLPGVAQVAM